MSKNRIRELRKSHNMTQKELGNILHYDQQYVSSMELNQITIPSECLTTISDHFKVSTDYILCRSDEKITTEEARKISSHLGEYTEMLLKYEALSPESSRYVNGLIDLLYNREHQKEENS